MTAEAEETGGRVLWVEPDGHGGWSVWAFDPTDDDDRDVLVAQCDTEWEARTIVRVSS